MGTSRGEVVGRVADLLAGCRLAHPVRVAIDGPDVAGKTTFADDVAGTLRSLGRPVLRVSCDDFQRPAAQRHLRGSLSPEGYFLDAFDWRALRDLVLDPLGPGGNRRFRRGTWDYRTDSPRDEPSEPAPRDAVLLDGVFLLREELRDCWDLSIFLEISPPEELRRALTRDLDLFGSPGTVRERYGRRYLPAQRLYREAARPTETADVLIDNEDPLRPDIMRWRPRLGSQPGRPELIGGQEKRAIRIVDYDPGWPERFAAERGRIGAALGDLACRIDHVGSTAVPGLPAKPIVDIDLSVPYADDEAAYLGPLLEAGYHLRVREPGHRMVRTRQLDVQVHICSTGSGWERRHLLFRDWLRRDAHDRARYAELKRQLATRDWASMNDYADAKGSLIAEITGRAEAWALSSGWTVAD